VCNLGYTVAGSKLNTYWATDLLHRLLHVPTISEGIVDHFAEDYAGILELAKTKSDKSGIDSNALQYFAIDVWAYDIAAPGIGCTGKPQSSKASSASTPAPTSTPKPDQSATSSAPTVSKSLDPIPIKLFANHRTGMPYSRRWRCALCLGTGRA